MTEEFYLTKKKRKLNGKRLETFNKFWEIFDYKRGRAEAADSWLDIAVLNNEIVTQIYLAAKNEAIRRQRLIDSGRTPKMAQGWITARRWEDDLSEHSAAPKPRSKSTGIDNLVRAYNILVNVSEEKFKEFCEGVRMDPEDRERVWNKYQYSFNINQLTRKIG